LVLGLELYQTGTQGETEGAPMGDPEVSQGHADIGNNFYLGCSGIISEFLSVFIIFINRIVIVIFKK
jgi:hypothetical protein